MMSFLLEPFQYEFFRNGMIAATLTGALCGLMGVYIVVALIYVAVTRVMSGGA